MAEVVVIEFSEPNAVNLYHRVNKILGWEGGAPDADNWPAGMLSHIAGESGDKLVVVEVWQSQADQQAFMQSQLGPAFAEAEVPQPARIEWFADVADIHRH
jgi:hypothetical protein